MKRKYSYRSGFRCKVSAEIVGSELEKLRKMKKLSGSKVVDAARPEDAPLHPAFTWNDKVAAEKYRTQEARELIRAVYVVPEDGEPHSAFVHIAAVSFKDEGHYESVDVVVTSPDLFATALAELQQKANSALEAVRQLELAARGSNDAERLSRISLAVKAFETAADVVRTLH